MASLIRALACAVSLVVLASAASAQTVTVDPARRSVTPEMHVLPIHLGGRVLTRPSTQPLPTGALTFIHQWPGVYFEAGFAGREVVLRFDDAANEYRLLIDDLDPIRLAQPGHVDVRIDDLDDAPHRLRLEKVTESADRSAAFEGFYVPPSVRPAPPVVARTRRLEFIGDSAMTGYGIRSTTRQCTKEEVRLQTDTQAAWAALVSRHFDADYQINAISGRGLIRNFGGVAPEDPMTHAYGFAVRDLAAPYSDPDWRPQIVFVSLFADFAGDLSPDEPWKTTADLGADWAQAYAAFVSRIHVQTPGAAIVIGWLDLGVQTDAEFIALANTARQAIEAAADQGGFRVAFMEMPSGQDYDMTACDYHPGLADQRRLADHVTAYLEAHPDLWRDRP